MAEITPERMAHLRRQWAWAGRLAAGLAPEPRTSTMKTTLINGTGSEQAWRIWRDATAWLRITDQIRLKITTSETYGTAAEADEPVPFVLELVSIDRLARCARC